MNFRSAAIILVIQCLMGSWVYSQAYFNFEDAYLATPICDLSLIHGRQFTNPVFVETKGDLKCGMGGKEDNIIIFPFIATASSMSITITGQSCTNPSTLRGLQGGIMQDTSGVNCLVFYGNLVMVGTTADFTLSSSSFIPGNKYYLWLDGNGGSSCQFTINITQGNGAAPTLKEIAQSENILNGISGNGLLTDTISFCLGPDTLKMEIPSNGLDLSYQWFLEPGPDSTFSDTTIDHSNLLELYFDKLGTYKVRAVATNGCTFSDTLQMTVIVTDLPPVEIFPDIVLCPEEASELENTLRLYDPNGDGFFGFGGSPQFFNQDSIRSSVINKFNCNIEQIGRAVILTAPDIGRDTVIACGSYTLPNGSTITNTQTASVVVGTSVVTGCDSTKLTYVYIPAIAGDLHLAVCGQSADQIAFVTATTGLELDDTLTFIWKQDGVVVTDSDGIDSILVLNKVRGTYSLEIYSTWKGSKCLIYSNAIEYLGADLGPSKPSISITDTVVCAGEGLVGVRVKSSMAEGYIWNIPGVLGIVYQSPSGDSLILDFTKLGDTTLFVEVAARNGCDTTEFVMSPFISRKAVPNMDFSFESEACITTGSTIAVAGNPSTGYAYRWDLSDATITNGNINIFGDLSFTFPSDGPRQISLTASHAVCGDSTIIDTIQVFNEASYITPTCRSDANSIIISWLDQDCISEYEIFANGQSLGTTDSISYKYDMLEPNTEIMFRIEGLNICGCENINLFANCKTINCQSIDLITSISDTVACEGEAETIVLSATEPGFFPGGKFTFMGDQMDTLGNINVAALPAGSHTYTVNYFFEGCNVSQSYELMVRPAPQFEIEYKQILCAGETQTPFTITYKTADQMTFTIDGQAANASGFLTTGTTYDFEGTDFAGCTSSQSLAVQTAKPDGYEIVGSLEIFDNDILELYVEAIGNTILDSAVWIVNGENRCQSEDCLELINFNLSPGTYQHELTIFLNGCSTDTNFTVTVRPSFGLFIPNAFSPDALDFENQVFSLKTSELNGTVLNFAIYSRWGELVFQQTTDNGDGWAWDGTMHGKTISRGVYVYVVEYEDEKGVIRSRIGDVTMY